MQRMLLAISALKKMNTDYLFDRILQHLTGRGTIF